MFDHFQRIEPDKSENQKVLDETNKSEGSSRNVGYTTGCTGSLMRPFRYTAIVAGSKLPMMLMRIQQ